MDKRKAAVLDDGDDDDYKDYDDEADMDMMMDAEPEPVPEQASKRPALQSRVMSQSAYGSRQTVNRTPHGPVLRYHDELKSEDDQVSFDPMLWRRPELPQVNPITDAVAFQWVDIEMYAGEPLAVNPAGGDVVGARVGQVPVIRLFGATMEGRSVAAHIHGFTPYFYCNAPTGFTEGDLGEFRVSLNDAVRKGKEDVVLSVQLLHGWKSLMGYHRSGNQTFIKVYTAMPTHVPPCRTALERGIRLRNSTIGFQCYEANVPYVLRFMIDCNVQGCNWVEAPRATYSVRTANKVTNAQAEIDIFFNSLVSHEPTGEWQKVAPLRVLSFDIECQGRQGHFPEPEHDPVIQIASVLSVQGEPKPRVRNVFVLNTCSPIPGAQVFSNRREVELMDGWSRFVRECDPDIITGYNIANFDLPYLLNRAKKLQLHQFALLGRVLGSPAAMKNTTFSSAAFGKRENVETTISGRTIFDMIQYMFRNHKLSSYSLNAVCSEFLGQQKEDVHHSHISDLQNGTDADRHRLALYCLKDAELPLRLMQKLMVLINHMEMARVTGVPLSFLLARGQQIKVLSMLYRKCRKSRLLIPTMQRDGGGGGEDDVGYEGATVIEPLKAFYADPIATLDFASLYPSIMMAHNLCYSTLIAPEDLASIPADHYAVSPCGHAFVKSNVKKGLLPEILEELLAARKVAKKDMAKATDPMIIAVQNGRQLALKVSANSVYGFTGATRGSLPCIPISSSVTSYGRDMIQATKKAVEEQYCIANGYSADAIVVYGDTDSVMVKFGVSDIATAMDLGLQASKFVSKLFPPPVSLEFEKVYCPYLLMNKKRYAGLLWTKPTKYDKLDAKGIETVRRDNCALVRTVVDKCLHMILVDKQVDGAVDYVKLLRNKIDISMLVITKALGKGADSDDYTAKQAHVELAARMRKRDPGTAPVVGDRVPYVIIQAGKGVPNYMKSEDPLYVLKNNVPIDVQYYLEKQLEGPLSRIFAPIVKNTSSLFQGDHTRTIIQQTPSAGTGIAAFTVRTFKCMECRTSLPPDRHTLCERCEPLAGQVLCQAQARVNVLERKHNELWTQCQRCQGSLVADVICQNRDCPIFYMREKVKFDLADATETLGRFSLDW